jgi:hypothetical protein
MEYTLEQVEEWKDKAEKWDRLNADIAADAAPSDVDLEVLQPGDACHGPYDIKWVAKVFKLFTKAGYRVPNDVLEGKKIGRAHV